MDKLHVFSSCLRYYIKADRAEKNYERALSDWKMCETDLINKGWFDDFIRYAKSENKNDNDYWNHLMREKERELKE